MGKKDSIRKPTSSGISDDDEQCQVRCDLVENNRILKCQYKISQIAVEDWRSFDTALQAIIELVPHGFESPKDMVAAIQLNDKTFQTPGFRSSKNRYGRDVVVDGKVFGSVEVGYLELENLIQKLIVIADRDTVDIADLPASMRFNINSEKGLNKTLAQVESEHINRVLDSVGGNKSKAAQILKINRKTLREKLKKIQQTP